MHVLRHVGHLRRKAIVIAKSLMSTKNSSPKVVFSSLIASMLFALTILSIFSMIALILAIQSEGPNFWMGSYLNNCPRC
jgi:hypothetical protein